ncbi:hypothetical protein BCR32DRAFT_285625 [Anaeromyces robustus]|uniref:Acyltransferase 3 domain-containing protein n=1 Tax=Anaeromyces robustus TaxID=1754192 RepID=A0A1Y1WJD3_9FUNG|nr:hypothetical protein BCR32DRAFT_285625 [Anaeromyces robustus]|eukprot:ORX73465.1 hypothetical protein BCR32DRAFT_285625 [Anaeromyces robustus]
MLSNEFNKTFSKDNSTQLIKEVENEEKLIENEEKERLIVNIIENQESNVLKPKERQSNIELLRIISMIFIIMHHFSVHGKFKFNNKTITMNRLWIQFMNMGGKINVNIYVLISGYFLVNSKKLKINKILKLELQLITYSLIDFVIGVVTDIKPFDFNNLIKHLFPVINDYWWFSTNYVFLYLFFPLINVLIHALKKETYRNYLIFMITIWSVIPTLYRSTVNQCSELIWFAFLYFLAGYLRKYPIGKNTGSFLWIFLGLMSYLLTFSSALFCDYFGQYYEPLLKYFDFFFGYQKFPALLTSVFLLLAFSKMNFSSRFINLISSSTFGIYLLHDSPYVRNFIWRKLLVVSNYKDSYILIPYSIVVVLSVFTVGSIIELIRIHLLEKYYMKLVDSFSKILEKLFS